MPSVPASSALSVITNVGHQKTHRPDLVAKAIRKESQGTVLIAIAHQHHGQTGRLMAIALELQQHNLPKGATPLNRLFWLAHPAQNPQSAMVKLNQSLTQLLHPLDLWLVNFQQMPDQPLNTLLNQQNCVAADKAQSVDGYRYRQYHCLSTLSREL